MVRLIKEVNHYHYGNSSESRRKEIADRFGKSFTPDDHNILCKDGKVLNIQIGKKYRCTACNGQRVEIVDIEETFEDGTAMLDVAYRNNRYTVASTQIYESIKRNKRVKEDFTVTDADYGRDIAEEVANIMQDMDWQDSLDDSYDNPDEAWDAYVDQVLEQLESDPQEVIDWLEDEEGSDVHRSLIRNIIKCFGGSVSESVKKKNSKSTMIEGSWGSWASDIIHNTIFELQEIFGDADLYADYANYYADLANDYGKFTLIIYASEERDSIEICRWNVEYNGDTDIDVYVIPSKDARRYYMKRGDTKHFTSFDDLFQYAQEESYKMIDSYRDFYFIMPDDLEYDDEEDF